MLDKLKSFINSLPKGSLHGLTIKEMKNLLGCAHEQDVQKIIARARMRGVPVLYKNGKYYVANGRYDIERYFAYDHLKEDGNIIEYR